MKQEEKYLVRFFDGDNVIFTYPYEDLEHAAACAVTWDYDESAYEVNEEEGVYGIDYVEVLRNNDDGTQSRIFWMNTEAKEGIDIDDEDPDYAFAEKTLDENK